MGKKVISASSSIRLIQGRCIFTDVEIVKLKKRGLKTQHRNLLTPLLRTTKKYLHSKNSLDRKVFHRVFYQCKTMEKGRSLRSFLILLRFLKFWGIIPDVFSDWKIQAQKIIQKKKTQQDYLVMYYQKMIRAQKCKTILEAFDIYWEDRNNRRQNRQRAQTSLENLDKNFDKIYNILSGKMCDIRQYINQDYSLNQYE